MDDLIPIDAIARRNQLLLQHLTWYTLKLYPSDCGRTLELHHGATNAEVSPLVPDETTYEIVATGTGNCNGTANVNHAALLEREAAAGPSVGEYRWLATTPAIYEVER